jgi:hypothetical protein
MASQPNRHVYIALRPSDEPGWQFEYEFESGASENWLTAVPFEEEYPLMAELLYYSENTGSREGERPVRKKSVFLYKTLTQTWKLGDDLAELQKNPVSFLAPESVPEAIVAAGWRYDAGNDCWLAPEPPAGQSAVTPRLSIGEGIRPDEEHSLEDGRWDFVITVKLIDINGAAGPAAPKPGPGFWGRLFGGASPKPSAAAPFSVTYWKKYTRVSWYWEDDPDTMLPPFLDDIRAGKDAFLSMNEKCGRTNISVRPQGAGMVRFILSSTTGSEGSGEDVRHDHVLPKSNVLEEFEWLLDCFTEHGGWGDFRPDE